MLRRNLALAVIAFCFTLITGCSGGGSPSNTPVTAPALSVSALSAFSAVSGSASAPQTLTFTNTGTATLTISGAPVLGGANPTAFAMTTTCGSSLAPNASCNVTLTFTAPGVGSYSATMTISDNVAGSPQAVTLNGTGTAVPAPTLAFSPGGLTFTATNVGTTSAAQSVTITNSGNAALTISSIALSGGTPSAFSLTNTCGSSVAANASCSISVTFTPGITGSLGSSVVVTDNATGSPQSFSVSGTGVAPTASLSGTSLLFTAAPNTTSASQAITLTNNGGATLNISGITLGGTNASNFAETTTCGTTLAAAANCSISATFTPTASTNYSASVSIADNATGSPQSISLTGTGTGGSAISYQLYELPDPGNGAGSGTLAALYALVNNAQHTIDMTMYALQDTTFSGYLVAACKRGVVVRVVLDQNNEKSHDTPAYNQLNAQAGCSAVWANTAFAVTHEKSFIVDGTQMALMSLNLQSQYYSTTRDYAMVYNDPIDIAAVRATFNMDYAAGTPASGIAGASDYSYQPTPGNDLIWSPTTSKASMLSIINNAKTSLIIENEELGSSAGYIVSAIAAACQRGVTTRVLIENESHTYDTQFTTLKAAGCSVHYYSSSTGFYVHAKAVVADDGLTTQNAYMGSINYSNASMTQNRELGMFISDTASVQTLYTAMVADFNNATGIF